MEIIKNITNRNRTISNGRAIKYIVIHFVGAVSSAKANSNYFKNTYRGASAHYFVDDGSIYQVVEDKDVAWHCGANSYKHKNCRNSNSIGVEMCCFKNGSKIDINENVVNRTIELTKELMTKYNIPIENVIRHYDVTGKACPEPFISNVCRWNNFKSRLGQVSTSTQVSTSNNTMKGDDVEVRRYENGKTSEAVYADTACNVKIGSLDPRERCDCLGVFNNKAMVRYQVGSTGNYKIGFVKWLRWGKIERTSKDFQ